jgi:CheY-like chemotaxis protein
MPKKVLWLDNDPAYINVYRRYLEEQPDAFKVTVVPTLTEAETSLKQNPYDLLILDAMIPTKTAQEETAYPPDDTEHGLNTGLAFFRRYKEALTKSGTKVLVLTARIDDAIQDGFATAGLPEGHVVAKPSVARVRDFLEIVEEVLGHE